LCLAAGGSPQDGEGEQTPSALGCLFGTPGCTLGTEGAQDALSLCLLESRVQMSTRQILLHELHLETPVHEVGRHRSCDELD
jgi:hypothetical protein